MIREDGSIQTANNSWNGRYNYIENGVFKAVVRSIVYTDDQYNDSGVSGSPAQEVLYNVMIVGGIRDGQIFNNARVSKSLGGFGNYSETTLKDTVGISNQDISSTLALSDPSLNDKSALGGDSVYIQFLNGSLRLPIIIGMGKHNSDPNTEASAEDGPRKIVNFNGIYTKITKDGEFTWSKANGAYLPTFPNPDDPLQPFVNQFAPTLPDAFKLTLGNKFDLLLAMSLGQSLALDGVADQFALTLASGTALTLTGLATDSFLIETALGTSLKVAGGTSDSFTLDTAAGAALSIKGLSDVLLLSTAGGSSLELSGVSGLSVKTSTGDSLILGTGAATLKTSLGAQLVLDKTGLIKLGNATGDVLQILKELITTLSTETAAGFNAPLNSVVKYVELLTKITLIIG